ncbi:hypothetical protein BKA82DRAFT_128177 [Pisolithus tinctorius]|uniref:ZZ-type domain-containing protein n=1 Tax=Pisolithus tinctorius Marx 270 TaxID=870435 RepID=A0A0C3KMR9_PISTI|nr:hypothetical protein BKA82DRAFT_128177 [Pisolithus tinctorius]KIO10877.1 hypothetical protein M404DRAFT_128177 [Pisolithus tinctorius Marx 270]
MHSRPDRPLLVKCAFDGWNKRISFASARNCSYDLLRERIEQCFSLSATPYVISYRDDDGEVTDITAESDLTEAIQYFQAGSDDPPLSSAASILSGRSFGSKRITLRVHITVDYDGPSLSDTSSLASLDEYKGRNESSSELNWVGASGVGGVGEFEDDTVTVSSRDNSGRLGNGTTHGAEDAPVGHARPAELDSLSFSIPEEGRDEGPFSDYYVVPDPNSMSDDVDTPRVKEVRTQAEDISDRLPSHRGAAWLRDQNARTIRAMLGTSPEPSDVDSRSISLSPSDEQFPEGSMGGDLALQRDRRGRYYYSYTGGGSATHDSGYEDGFSCKDGHEPSAGSSSGQVRPTSMQLCWLASQQQPPDEQSIGGFTSECQSFNTADIPPELLPFVTPTSPPPGSLTTCSECGVLLDAIRYVCAMCGEKEPASCSSGSSTSGKYRERDMHPVYTYPPTAHLTPPQTSSSPSLLDAQTLVGSMYTRGEHHKPLPPLPGTSPTLYSSQGSNSRLIPETTGYELCSGCIESAGIYHALQESTQRMDDLRLQRSSPEDALSLWRRSAPRQKGQMRHAYFEKVWGPRGWEDVEQEDMQSSKCSTCNSTIVNKRFKCASCKKFNLCRACYNQVHDIHPAHSFLIVLGKPTQPRPEIDVTYVVNGNSGEPSMKHPGVKCAHCLQDIVGARFHCAICDSLDICSNCEAVGLPGNLDPSDGGHISSHIMIKIPYPLESNEVRTASRHAIHLWTGRDAAQVLTAPRSKPSSVYSSYAQTVVGSRMQLNLQDDVPEDHHINCNGCNETIFGIRYQCATCPSLPTPYSLCTTCEERSYLLHDPMHSFFKLPRPVRRPLESSGGFLPKLYKVPAGPLGGTEPNADPKEYLSFLVHSAALCDRCMERIRGPWYRCAYCAKDLCGDCEAVDTHDVTHVFVVFKAPVDMPRFRQFANVENPSASPPLIPFPVYF